MTPPVPVGGESARGVEARGGDAPMPKVLIVDDQAAVRTALETLFELGGLTPVAVSSAEEALDQIATEDIGAVVQDMNFTEEQTSGADGVRLFRAIRQLDPDMPIVLVTSWTSLETAVALLKEGASDYIAKPWDQDKLLRTVENLVDLRRLKHDNIRLLARDRRARSQLAARHQLCGLVYASPRMHEAVHLAIAVAPSDASILITGPNGSGKEKIAEIIVANSRRRDQPFIKVNVGALPESLFEAELFGAEAGAYTGAAKTRIGRFEAAEGGTQLQVRRRRHPPQTPADLRLSVPTESEGCDAGIGPAARPTARPAAASGE